MGFNTVRYYLERSRPWFFQINYLVVFGVMLGVQILPYYGAKPLLMLLVIVFAACLQFNRRASIMRIGLPVSLKLYLLWGVWALAVGFFCYRSYLFYFSSAKMLVRQMFFLSAIYALLIRQRQHVYLYWMLIGIALVQVVAVKMGFHLQRGTGAGEFANEIVVDVLDASTTRMTGLTGNANSMGFLMLYGVWACMMLWRQRLNRFFSILKIVLLPLFVLLFSYYTIQTGSRKSLLGLALYFCGFSIWMLPGKISVKAILVAGLMGLLVLIIGIFAMDYVMSETLAGQRFQELFDAGGGSAAEGFKEDVRYSMYMEGFKYWLSHPICGIGLGQFAAWHFSRTYSHSDYMEPLACTGIVGFVLYHGFAYSIFLKVIKLLRRPLPSEITYQIKGMVLFLLVSHYWIGFGGPHWDDALHCMIIVFIGVYAWRIQEELIKHRFVYGT
ncbi:MAG: O-antigen ligase family protein [Prevotellaceae bacterium]|nr:O-antigen ligase family protein [Prevotellaceae bacterium]